MESKKPEKLGGEFPVQKRLKKSTARAKTGGAGEEEGEKRDSDVLSSEHYEGIRTICSNTSTGSTSHGFRQR